MTDIEKVEELLNEYKILKLEIEAIDINIKCIGQKGMNYTCMPSSKNITDGVHNNYSELEKLKNDKFDKEIKIEQRITNQWFQIIKINAMKLGKCCQLCAFYSKLILIFRSLYILS